MFKKMVTKILGDPNRKEANRHMPEVDEINGLEREMQRQGVDALRQVKAAGARILRQGEFGPGSPYLYIEDPDGYTIEIWFE